MSEITDPDNDVSADMVNNIIGKAPKLFIFTPRVNTALSDVQVRGRFLRISEAILTVAKSQTKNIEIQASYELPANLVPESKALILKKRLFVSACSITGSVTLAAAILLAVFGVLKSDASFFGWTVAGLILPSVLFAVGYKFSQDRKGLSNEQVTSVEPNLEPHVSAANTLRDASIQLYAEDGHGQFHALPSLVWGLDNWLAFLLTDGKLPQLLFANSKIPKHGLYVLKSDLTALIESRSPTSEDLAFTSMSYSTEVFDVAPLSGVPEKALVSKNTIDSAPQAPEKDDASVQVEQKNDSTPIELEIILTSLHFAKKFERIILQLGARKTLLPQDIALTYGRDRWAEMIKLIIPRFNLWLKIREAEKERIGNVTFLGDEAITFHAEILKTLNICERDEKRLLKLQRSLAKVSLLIIDELGFVPLSKTGAELLFELISLRYECGSTLITSNLPFEKWTETFGTERLTGALLDRLTHHVSILEMNGDSYRLAQSKARLDTA